MTTTTRKRTTAPDPKPSRKAPAAKKAAAPEASAEAIADAPKRSNRGRSITPETAPAPAEPKLYDEVKDVPSVPSTAKAATNKLERVRLAKAEFTALKEWRASGAEPPRPATPNLDAMHNNSPTTSGAEPVSSTRTVHPKIEAARAAAKAGKRGKGKPITDEELAAYVLAIRAEVPGVSRSQAQQINWWVDGFACGIQRFNNAWDATVTQAQKAS